MKKYLILIYALMFLNTAFGQITLEHTYFENNDSQISMQGIQDIGNNEYKYIFQKYDGVLFYILLYNLDHSLYYEITLPEGYTMHNHTTSEKWWIGKYIFDDDDDIEYAIANETSDLHTFKILNIDGSELFTINESKSERIYPAGGGIAKLFIKKENSNGYYYQVYNINKYWTSKIINLNKKTNLKLYDAYPNPSNGTYTIKYNLPEDIKKAEIVFYSLTGVELKRYTVDNTFNTLIVNNEEFPKGTYVYKLITENNSSNTKKVIQK